MDRLIFRLLFHGLFSSDKETRLTTWIVLCSFLTSILLIGTILWISHCQDR